MFAIVGVAIITALYKIKYGGAALYPNWINTAFGFALVGIVTLALLFFLSLSAAVAVGLTVAALTLLIIVTYFLLPAPSQ